VRPYLKKKHTQERAGGVVQGVGLEFKPQYQKKKKKKQLGQEQEDGRSVIHLIPPHPAAP
jgi:hypothetical protein